MSCGVGYRLGSDPALLWLWSRLVAAAPIGPLVWVPPWCMEVTRLGVESELQLLASAVATAIWDPSRVCDLHHSSQQRRILNPLNKARD